MKKINKGFCIIYLMEIKKVAYFNGKYFFWSKGDLHTDEGKILENKIKKAKNYVESTNGRKFVVFDALINDQLRKIKRGPAIVLPKDAGLIITLTGIDKKSNILEAGTGTGYLTSHLSRFVKKVTTYEKRKEFYDIAKYNFEFLGIKNIKQYLKDIYEGITEKNLDLVVLDLAEPWQALSHIHNSLKQGRFLVCYLPNINQIQELLKKVENKFLIVKVTELIERDWEYENFLRPKSQIIGHTAFLVFLRKI